MIFVFLVGVHFPVSVLDNNLAEYIIRALN